MIPRVLRVTWAHWKDASNTQAKSEEPCVYTIIGGRDAFPRVVVVGGVHLHWTLVVIGRMWNECKR